MTKNIQKERISSSIEQMFSTVDKALDTVSKRGYLKQVKDEYEKVYNSSNESLAETQNILPEETFDQVYDDAERGLEKTKRNEPLTNKEKFATEAIILFEGRPPILIKNNKFENQPGGTKWHILENYRDQIEKSILSVGRVNLQGNINFEWVGTASLVSDDVLMTNAHVAIEFSRRQGEKWTFKPGQTGSIDFEKDSGFNRNEFEINGIIGIHDRYDLALLKVSNAVGDNKFPKPLTISQSVDESNIEHKNQFVIGCPASDSRRNPPIIMDRIFQGIYNVKRLQPGEIMGMAQDDANIMYHDSSTLGGNSGSPVFDLETNKVIGLHFGGLYREKNHAVALWKLANDPLLKNAGVNFQ
jgi:hypothetical protein